MKSKTLIVTLFITSMILTLATFIYVNNKVNKVVVVDVIRLFNEFEMKKELEASVDIELKIYTSKIDSVKGLIENAADKKSNEILYRSLFRLQEDAKSTYDIANKNINEQVWKRLNVMIKEYGKQNQYRVIIGANGMGSVIYNEDEIDKTEDLVKYVNSKYERGN